MSAVDSLPPLREVIARHGLAARKSLGQNFLLDLNITARIARAAGIGPGDLVYEVGPGPGGLTRALLAAGATVVAVERDERCLAALAEVAAAYAPGRLTVIPGDALEIDEPAVLGHRPAKVVANLPYNVGTALLIRWLSAGPWPPWWQSLTLMFQREVADRLTAAPRSDAYSRLTVLAQWRAQARHHFDLSPKAFVPPPKVTSTVVGLVPLAVPPHPCRLGALEVVTANAFGQRRKMLRQSLKGLAVPAETLLERAGIVPTARAEELDVAAFARLARALDQGPAPS
ncbi:16S rRNA (adenine(1518)-N(6)/adenine(1519)-N(6))-dimethyltransferase RsmA [Zavarzinia compransoris]|uniref:Ribosomal RNA small subunit methyltransferase A n=1 Tax=Zavarzinia compransoris TaxID=1264899 RepID=A0A317EC37_9PROT|nr:16S rRNA (adenine(1518)-N(6)/adenine(1519)-N(6))-dimethyltransferase RsmA [Zavarzinia compransoris]PWR23680.1 16S rRNA (adenine(1518)-N(6)/adenine(1519)-N(6))-dimethyltransferase [Zavarzinia compransoris]TDP47900.1 dimethyladenosine transferase [Zavarzinia compransoris]